jgi:hypothetical protein
MPAAKKALIQIDRLQRRGIGTSAQHPQPE